MHIALYSIMSEEHLKEILQTLQAFTGLPIQLLDPKGNVLCRFGERPRYCKLLNEQLFMNVQCNNLLMKAGQYAKSLGETYIFSCNANLNNVAFPLINRDILLGIIIIGPFLMDNPDSTILSNFAEQNQIPPDLLLDLYDELAELQILPPDRVNHLKKLLDYLLIPLLPDERVNYAQAQKRFIQQAKINEAIQTYKEEKTISSQKYFYEKERELLVKARTGNISEAKALLNELLGYVLFNEGGTTQTVRIHAIELATLLSRVAMDSGAKVDYVYSLNNQFVSIMSEDKNIEELCYMLQDVAENFMEAAFTEKENANHHIREAVRYIAEHYHEKLTMAEVAGVVGLSEGHFSRLFKKCVGITFRNHLCQVRVEESKHLLRATEYSLSDIAVAVGFPDQSYYCKVFKQITGITPRQFR